MDGPVPQIQEKIVEVIKVILQEQCQRMCLFTLERRVIPPAITRSAAVGGGLRTVAPLAGMGQQDDHGPHGGMTLALDADTATLAGREQEGRPRTARRCRCDHAHSAREVRPCWRGRRPGLRICDAAHLQPSGRPTWHGTQIQQALDLPLPPLRRLQVSCRVRRDQKNDGLQAVGHARGQASIALDVLRDGVQCAPILHREHGRDGREALGPGAPRLGETEAGRTGALHRRRRQAKSHDLDGRDHDRHHHGPAHRGRHHETSGAGPASAREALLHLQREPLVHGEHMPGADRMAWRLGAKTRVPALGAAVGLCLCPSKGLLAGMDPYCSSGVPRALHPGWPHSGATAGRHRDPAASQAHSIKQQAMQFFAESVCRNEAVLSSSRRARGSRIVRPWTLVAGCHVAAIITSDILSRKGRRALLRATQCYSRKPPRGASESIRFNEPRPGDPTCVAGESGGASNRADGEWRHGLDARKRDRPQDKLKVLATAGCFRHVGWTSGCAFIRCVFVCRWCWQQVKHGGTSLGTRAVTSATASSRPGSGSFADAWSVKACAPSSHCLHLRRR